MVLAKGNGEEDHLRRRRVLRRVGGNAGPEFLSQRGERLGPTGVGKGDFEVLLGEEAGEGGADLAGTDDGVFHEELEWDGYWMEVVMVDDEQLSGL